jgi:CubicO group peptidase (beta-lactamase class C family)
LGQKPLYPQDAAVNEYVQSEMKATGAPGIAVAVVKNGTLLHCNTYGIANAEYNLPVTENTAFQIASVTKLFTSTLVLKYIQDQKLNLEDYISKYISNAPESWKTIQVKHLLAHEGGIMWPSSLGGYMGIGGNNASFKVEPMDELIGKLKDSALVFQPGTKQMYQNGDYFVLQYILEKIGGKPIEELFQSDLFTPLTMTNSGFDKEVRTPQYQTMQPLKNKSQNFTKGKQGLLVFKGFYAPSSYTGGGMYLTIADAVKWAVSLDKETYITNESQSLFTKKTNVKEGFTYLGWTYQLNQGHEMIGHSGGPGLGDIFRFPKEKLTVIVLSNYADMFPYMAAEIAQMYIKDITLAKVPKTIQRQLPVR